MEDSLYPSMIVWVDPGKMNGYAYLTGAQSFHSGELEFPYLCQQLELSASIHGSSLWLGWEQFLINSLTASKHGSELALETIGVLKYLALKYECTLLNPCPPSGRELGSLIKLKRLGWYKPGKGHANDAASHLLAFLLRDHIMPDDLLQRVLMRDNEPHDLGSKP